MIDYTEIIHLVAFKYVAIIDFMNYIVGLIFQLYSTNIPFICYNRCTTCNSIQILFQL